MDKIGLKIGVNFKDKVSLHLSFLTNAIQHINYYVNQA